MNTVRIKNIIIMILVLLNVMLLALLLSRRAEKHAARERAVHELVALYAASGIELSPSLLPEECAYSVSEPVRDTEAEQRFASLLLGEAAVEDIGGGIYRYAGNAGQCLIRSSGAVEASLDRQAGDADVFCEELLSTFGYTAVTPVSDVTNGTIEAVRTLGGGNVFNAGLTFSFSGGHLRSVTGIFLPPLAEVEGYTGMDAITALVSFLDHSNASGTVCTRLIAIERGYLLQSSASAPLRLVPAWRIETDVSNYYVNLMTGEVIRE